MPYLGATDILNKIFNSDDNTFDVSQKGSIATDAVAVTPNDANDLAKTPTEGLYIGVTGDVKVDMADGSTVTFTALKGGIVYPYSVSRVYATNTTATDIIALYLGNMQWIPNYALSFDGVDDYVKVNSFGFSEPYITVEFWAEINTLTGKNYAFDTFNNRQPLMKWDDNDTTVITWGLGAAGYSHYMQGNKVNELVHYAMTYDGSTEKLYVDGNQVSSKTGSGSIAFEELYIGEFNGLGYSLDGLIDDFRLWNTARTQQQIQDNMNTELTGNETGLVAYYKMDEGTGTTLTDYAGNNDGTIIGATWQEVE